MQNFRLFDVISAFVIKTLLWKSISKNDTLEIFVNLSEYLEENFQVFEGIKRHILNRVSDFDTDFKNFSKPNPSVTRIEVKSIWNDNRWKISYSFTKRSDFGRNISVIYVRISQGQAGSCVSSWILFLYEKNTCNSQRSVTTFTWKDIFV